MGDIVCALTGGRDQLATALSLKAGWFILAFHAWIEAENETGNRYTETGLFMTHGRFLITGGAGFIGSALSAQLIADGHDVMVVDDFVFDYQTTPGPDYDYNISHRLHHLLRSARIERCSLQEKQRLAQLVAEYQPTGVIHLAAIPLVSVCTQRPELARQVLSDGLLNLVEAVSAGKSVSRFVYVSSSMVYGHFERDIIDESSTPKPISVYGALKLAGEILSNAYLRPRGIEVVVVRPSSVYGPFDQHRRVLKKFVEDSFAGVSLSLNATNDHTMDFTYIDDVVQGLVASATHPRAANEVFNITCGRGRSLSNLAAIIRSHLPNLSTNDDPIEDADRPRRGGLNIEKARSLLGYNPEWPLERGIAHYIDHCRSRELAQAPQKAGASNSDDQ